MAGMDRGGPSGTDAPTNTGAGHLLWSSPRRRLGGGRAAVLRAWRVQEMPGRKGSRSGEGKGDAWEGNPAGGGARGPAPAVSDGAGAEQRVEAAVAEEEEGRQESEGPICNFPKSSGTPL
jgi:hypothetical protein